MKPFILIIEDDPDIAESIRYNLERDGSFVAQVALTGEAGLNIALGKGQSRQTGQMGQMGQWARWARWGGRANYTVRRPI